MNLNCSQSPESQEFAFKLLDLAGKEVIFRNYAKYKNVSSNETSALKWIKEWNIYDIKLCRQNVWLSRKAQVCIKIALTTP